MSTATKDESPTMAATYIMHGAVRSSAAYRARIALNLKGVAFREIYLDLAAASIAGPEYLGVNPQGLVPTLICPDGTRISAVAGDPGIPRGDRARARVAAGRPADRARVRSIAQAIACDIHPVNNMRLRNHVKALLPDDPDAVGASGRRSGSTPASRASRRS